ncbi:MAG: hypothetical protein J5802_07685 [Butyrivibrio sp.]|nr:hypothetical protein [Butyrivibrio sp.]
MIKKDAKKSSAIRAVLSVTLASTIFLSSGIGAAVVRAEGTEGDYINNTSGMGSISDFIKYAQEGKDLSDKTVILSTNDAKCDFDKYPYVASLKNFFEDDLKSDVILIDSGDFCHGKEVEDFWSANGGNECMDNYDNDYAAFLAMNEAGYDYANFGNYGYGCGNDGNKAGYPDCNIVNFDSADNAMAKMSKGKDENYKKSEDFFSSMMDEDYLCDNSFIYDCADSDMKIGFFGLPEYEAGCNAAKSGDIYASAEQQAEDLKKKGADLVVCLSQLGLGGDNNIKGTKGSSGGNGLLGLFGNLLGLGGKSGGSSSGSDFIDLLLDGVSLFSEGESAIPLKLADMLLRNIGVTIIDNDSKSIEDNFLFSLEDIIKNLGADKNTSSFINNMIGSFGFDLFGDTDCDFDCDFDFDYDCSGNCGYQPKTTPKGNDGGKPSPSTNSDAPAKGSTCPNQGGSCQQGKGSPK